jgi:hypothetical protein
MSQAIPRKRRTWGEYLRYGLFLPLNRTILIAVIERRCQRSMISGDGPISRHARKDCFRVGRLPLVCGAGAAEPGFAHARSPYRESSYCRRLHHVFHLDAHCSSNLLQSLMAAGRSSPKQNRVRHLDEPRNRCWRGATWDSGLRDGLLRYIPLPLIGEISPFHSSKSRPAILLQASRNEDL